MSRIVSVSKLRRNITQLIESLNTEGAIQIVKHGETIAYLLSPEQFQQLEDAYVLAQIRAGNFTTTMNDVEPKP